MDTIIGKIVTSKSGRDKGSRFAVIGIGEGDHVYIADGKIHKIAHPKKKKLKHLSFEREPLAGIDQILTRPGGTGDAALRRALSVKDQID